MTSVGIMVLSTIIGVIVMSSMASKVLDLNEHDNMTLDRLVNMKGNQQYHPVEIEEDLLGTETTYVFEDGSKLIRKIDERLGDLWTELK